MTAAAWLLLLGLRLVAVVVRWTFRRPLWLAPLRLVVLAGVMVLAARMVGT